MATTDTSAAIKAIHALYCDAEATLEVLAALGNMHAEWLKDQGHDTLGNTALRLMDEAQDALGDSADCHRAARPEADDTARDARVFVVNTGAAEGRVMAAKRTEGSWLVQEIMGQVYIFGANGDIVAKLMREGEFRRPGDALLIAAAPELLASLDELVSLCAVGDVDETTEALGWGAAIKAAKAAITKATGSAS